MPGCIQILDEHVANQIAAGEVVERPSSVVKELVENAIDAGATQIQVEVDEGGKGLVRVRDNGSGMAEQDAVLSLQRHATSKIASAEDLSRIHTLGFRGEALPSIAAVTQLRLSTRARGETVGTEVMVEGGTITGVREVGCPEGTCVEARHIFFNTPARLKFLRSDATEIGHISELVNRFVLAYPTLALSLTHNGQEVFRSPGYDDRFAAVVEVFGKDSARLMLPVEVVSPSLRLTGFVSRPSLTRASRSQQYFFANGRSIRSRALLHAVAEAYHESLRDKRHPIVILCLDLDPELVDVNVHPTKAEVRFTREWDLHNQVLNAIRQSLTSSQLAPEMQLQAQPRPAPEPEPPDVSGSTRTRTAQRDVSPPAVPTLALSTDWTSGASFDVLRHEIERKAEVPEDGGEPVVEVSAGFRLVPLRQIRNTYILAESDEGLLIVDQHRAHERVLLSKTLQRRHGQTEGVQRLVVPVALDLSHREAVTLESNLELLSDLAFELEPFGRDAYLVRAVPTALARSDYEQTIRDLIDELVTGDSTRHYEARRQDLLAMMACKAAIKAGDPLREPEIAALLADLMTTENPYICPHGQPIIVSISNLEMDRRFERA